MSRKQDRGDERARELGDLRQEVKHLRRKVSKLKGQLNKYSGSLLEPEIEEDMEPGFTDPKSKNCAICEEEMASFVTPSGAVRVSCKKCRKPG